MSDQSTTSAALSTGSSPPVTSDDIIIDQGEFDPLGPQVHEARLPSGRTVHYIDEGERDHLTLLFLGGAGTSVRAFGLLEFARSLRKQLRIRVVSIERNGLGQTAFDPAVGYTEHAADVWTLLEYLGTDQASLLAISGGGPYAAHVAAAQPDRVRSVHLACAFSENLGQDPPPWSPEAIAADPVAWWQFPPDSAVHKIPGFADSTIEEATRAMFALGRDTPPEGLRQAFAFYRDTRLPDLSMVQAPAFLYWGAADALVTTAHLDRWRDALKNVAQVRMYPGEGHDVQYRHWDQILTDVAHLGDRVIVCVDGRCVLARTDRATQLLADGATAGLCGWS